MYININYIQMKTQKTHFKYIPKKTQQPPSIKCIQNTTTYLYAYIINSVYRCISPLLFKDLHLSLAWNCKVLLGRLVLGATLYHASHTGSHISSLLHDIWLPIPFFIIFQTFSMIVSIFYARRTNKGSYVHAMCKLLLF